MRRRDWGRKRERERERERCIHRLDKNSLDETRLDCRPSRDASELRHLVVVYPPHHDRVDLQLGGVVPVPLALRVVKGGENAREQRARPTRQRLEALGLESVEGEVDGVQSWMRDTPTPSETDRQTDRQTDR